MATRTERMDMRLSREQKRLLERAALATGQPLTSFVLSSALSRAQEALERDRETVLGDRDRAAFLRLLESGDRPAPALLRAVNRARGRG